MKKTILILLVAAVLLVGIYYAVSIIDKGRNMQGVTVGNEYTATSTALWDTTIVSHNIDSGWGALGSVIVTEAGDAEFYLIDATTTPDNIDAYNTSTDALAYIPANLVAGTYTFDVTYNTGLTLYVVSGDTGTTTITFR